MYPPARGMGQIEVRPRTTGEFEGFDAVDRATGRVITSAASPEAALAGARNFLAKARNTGTYTSPHWPGIINPIAHLRLTDRVVDGKPTAFIEEIQSDVHQAGREQGYQDLGKAHELRDQVDRAGETWKAARESMGRMIGDALTFEQSTVEIPNPA